MNKNAIRTVILLGALLAVAQVQAQGSSMALQDPRHGAKTCRQI
jgi:hypothetical protein